MRDIKVKEAGEISNTMPKSNFDESSLKVRHPTTAFDCPHRENLASNMRFLCLHGMGTNSRVSIPTLNITIADEMNWEIGKVVAKIKHIDL